MVSFRLIRPLLLLVQLQVTQSLVSIVSGANGYVGRALVHELLKSPECAKNGLREIICLVRPHRIQSEQDYWNFHSNKEISSVIRVLPYDMLDGGATIRQALQSCNKNEQDLCFFHLASVFGPTEDHKQTALDNVQGTEDLVRVLAEEGHNKCKLILTSSMAAVRGTGQEPTNGKFYTHEDWNTVSQLGVNWGASYQWSKMQSEYRCKELCEKYGIPLIVLNPSFVFGPASRPDATSSYSLTLVGQWVRGESQVQSRLFVDVRDVAMAHVAAALRPGAVGKRYLLTTEARVPSQELAGWLQQVCRENGISEEEIEKIHFDANFDGGAIPIGAKEVEATDRLREELGITLTPVKDTIMDMARVLIEEDCKAT